MMPIVVWLELPCVDRMLFTSEKPVPGAKIVVPHSESLGGGVGGNFAAALRLFDVDVVAVGLATTDPLARTDYDDLISRGVELVEVEVQNGSVDPIVCTLIVPEDTDRTILIEYPKISGEDYASLRADFVSTIRRLALRGSVGTYLGVLRPESAKAILSLGTAVGPMACTLEASDWPTDDTAAVLDKMDVVFVAEETFLERREDIQRWHKRNHFDLIITLGSRGIRTVLRDGTVDVFPSVPPTSGRAVDTSGAVDCFAATYCAHAWAGTSHTDAIQKAAMTAGEHVAFQGARVRPDLLGLDKN